jgi:hypothetical protein
MNLEFVNKIEEKFQILSKYTLFGICKCCGRKFGICESSITPKQAVLDYNCFFDEIGEKCDCKSTDPCDLSKCKIDSEIKTSQAEQSDFYYNLILEHLRNEKEVLFNFRFDYQVNRNVYKKLNQLIQQSHLLARIFDKTLSKEVILIQFWYFKEKEKIPEHYYDMFPKLPIF